MRQRNYEIRQLIAAAKMRICPDCKKPSICWLCYGCIKCERNDFTNEELDAAEKEFYKKFG